LQQHFDLEVNEREREYYRQAYLKELANIKQGLRCFHNKSHFTEDILGIPINRVVKSPFS